MATIPPERFKNAVLSDYQPFRCIERTLHLEDIPNKNDKTLQLSMICEDDKSILPIGFKLLWFKVSCPENENHFYGNVSFSIEIIKVLDHFLTKGYKLYWIEKVFWDRSIDSRILLTKQKISNAQECTFKELGDPIYRDDSGIFYELKTLIGFQHEQKRHEVEFLIEASDEDSFWLFQNCDRIPVDHSKANSRLEDGRYMPRVCHKYNSNRRVECPNPNSLNETEQRMENINFKKIIHLKRSDDERHTSVLIEKEPEKVSVDTFSKVFLSIETGGLHPQDGILQIAVECEDYKYSTYVTPIGAITEEATEKHGITNINQFLFGSESNNYLKTIPIKEALENILGSLTRFHNCIMIANRLQFVRPFLEYFVNRSGLKEAYSKTILDHIDVQDVFKTLEGDKTQSYSLRAISERWLHHAKYDDSNSISKVTCLKNILSMASLANLTDKMLLGSCISMKFINYEDVETYKKSLKVLIDKKALSSKMANKMSKVGINYMFLKEAFANGMLSDELSMLVNGKPRITKDKEIIRKITDYFENIFDNESILSDKTSKINNDIAQRDFLPNQSLNN